MHETEVAFFSEGVRLSGLLRSPTEVTAPAPAIVQGPGWLGLKDAKLYLPYHEALTAAGFHVLIFDYRGFGDSGGDRGILLPQLQLEDLINAVTYLCTRDDVDSDNIGVFGSGGTGGGNAVLLAAADRSGAGGRVAGAGGRRRRTGCAGCAASTSGTSSWPASRPTAASGCSPGRARWSTPARRSWCPHRSAGRPTVKADVDDRIPSSVPLRCAEAILDYRPIDVVHKVSPAALMIIAVADDATTPTDHAERLYERATAPKKLIMQRHTTHYAAYKQYGPAVIPQMVDWYRDHFTGGAVEVHQQHCRHRAARAAGQGPRRGGWLAGLLSADSRDVESAVWAGSRSSRRRGIRSSSGSWLADAQAGVLHSQCM